jgi:hypothetical protein
MKHFLNHILVILSAGSLIFCQYKIDVEKLHSLPSLGMVTSPSTLFSPDHLNINHGFNLSVSSIGGKTVQMGSYTNSLSYLFKPNVLLQSNFTLYQMPGTFQQLSEIGYDLTLSYQPWEHSIFHFSIQKHPIGLGSSLYPFSLDKTY